MRASPGSKRSITSPSATRSQRRPSFGGIFNVIGSSSATLKGSRYVWSTSRRGGALGVDVHGVERLARGHEQAVPLWAAETEVAAHFRQTNPADEPSVRRPDGDAAIADRASGIARAPQIAVQI